MNNLDARTDRLIACAILLVWTGLVTVRYWNGWSIDMSAIYMAGYFAALGETDLIAGAVTDSFARQIPEAWYLALATLGHPDPNVTHFVYPPIWAYVVAPLASATEPTQFFNIMRPFVAGSFAISVVLAWRIMRPAHVSLTLWSLIAIIIAQTTTPWTLGVDLNQPQMIVVMIVLFAFDRYIHGRFLAAGALLGLAAAIKITPVLLCAIFLFDRQYRAVLMAGAVSGGLAVLSLIVAGWEPHAVFLARADQIAELVPYVGLNFTFETVMSDFFVTAAPCLSCINPLHGLNVEWVSRLSSVLLVIFLAWTLMATRRMSFQDRTKLRLMLVPLITLFFGPLAWMHYYALPVLLYPGLVALYPSRAVILAGIPFWAGFSAFLMEGRLDQALAQDNFLTFYPQHTAILSVVALLVLIAFGRSEFARKAPAEAVSV